MQNFLANFFHFFVVYLLIDKQMCFITYHNYTYMTLGERIKIARMQKKINQQALSNKANVHQKNISKYENNGVIPSAITLKNIANVLGVTTDYLLGNEHDDVIKDTLLLKYLKKVDKMPDDVKKALMTVIEAYIKNHEIKKPV